MAKYIIPHRRNETKNIDNRSYHAGLRMSQRDIDDEALKKVVNEGSIQRDNVTITHRTADTFCVSTSRGKIVTVMDNYRNTKFDLLNKTESREKYLLAKVKKNNDVAMCELAELYLDETFSNFNIERAYNLFLKAANEHKNSHAMCKIAQLHKSNFLGDKNNELYLEWMTKAANRGNKYATAVMGQHFMQKYSKLPIDASSEEKESISSISMEYFKKSADKGSTRAMWHIASIYQTGFFGEQDLQKAINIFIKAARRGSPNSLKSLQKLVYSKDIEPDLLEDILDNVSPIIANQSSQLSIDLGLEQIHGNLGADKERASTRGLSMLEESAYNRNKDALIELIELYKEGTNFIAKNSKKVVFWIQELKILYENAVLKGNNEAIFSLGNLWLSGDLGVVDKNQALGYFNDVTNLGNALYIYRFGMLLMEKNSNIYNYDEGKKLISKAMDIWESQVQQQDDVEAAVNIAEIYYDGDLGESDYTKAIEWFIIATNLGDTWSKYYLAKIYLLKLSEKNIKLATDYMDQILSEHSDDIDLVEKLYHLFPYLLQEDNAPEGLNWLVKQLLNEKKHEKKPTNDSSEYHFTSWLLNEKNQTNDSLEPHLVSRYFTKKCFKYCLTIMHGKEVVDYAETIRHLSVISYVTGSKITTKSLNKLFCDGGEEEKSIIKNWVKIFDNSLEKDNLCQNKLSDCFNFLSNEAIVETLGINDEYME